MARSFFREKINRSAKTTVPEHRNFNHGGNYYAPRRGTVCLIAVTRVAISLPAQTGILTILPLQLILLFIHLFFLYFIRHNSVTVFFCVTRLSITSVLIIFLLFFYRLRLYYLLQAIYIYMNNLRVERLLFIFYISYF